MIEKPPLIQGSGTENRSKSASHLQTIEKAANRSKRQRKKRFESAGHLLIIHLHAHLGPSCQTTGGFSYIQRLRRENDWRQFIRFEMNGGTDSEIEPNPASKRARTRHSIRNERETATQTKEPIAKLGRIPSQNERETATQAQEPASGNPAAQPRGIHRHRLWAWKRTKASAAIEPRTTVAFHDVDIGK